MVWAAAGFDDGCDGNLKRHSQYALMPLQETLHKSASTHSAGMNGCPQQVHKFGFTPSSAPQTAGTGTSCKQQSAPGSWWTALRGLQALKQHIDKPLWDLVCLLQHIRQCLQRGKRSNYSAQIALPLSLLGPDPQSDKFRDGVCGGMVTYWTGLTSRMYPFSSSWFFKLPNKRKTLGWC